MSIIRVVFMLQPGISPAPRWGIIRSDDEVFDFTPNTFIADSGGSPPTTPTLALVESATFPGKYSGSYDTTAAIAQFPNGVFSYPATLADGTLLAVASEYVLAGNGNLPPGTATIDSGSLTSLTADVVAAIGSGLTVTVGGFSGGVTVPLTRASLAIGYGSVVRNATTGVLTWCDPGTSTPRVVMTPATDGSGGYTSEVL